VDSFINHQVDPVLLMAVGEELAQRFVNVGATKVLTAEISGIAPALMTALVLKLPVVYARKSRPITMPSGAFTQEAPSHTKGKIVELIVSPEFLTSADRVLIVDDFLATGQTISALIKIVERANATLVGVGAVIEKSFEGGRAGLGACNVPVETLVQITDMSDGRIVFAD
jgi:xanthine phosphoribosyltransferase